jgi:hypothetical protein
MPIMKSTTVIDNQEVTIFIEVDDVPVGTNPYEDLRDMSQVISTVRDVFGEGMELARNCAIRAVDGINKIDTAIRPSEFEIQFAIKLNTEVGAILARMGSEAQIQVTMKWVHPKEAEV